MVFVLIHTWFATALADVIARLHRSGNTSDAEVTARKARIVGTVTKQRAPETVPSTGTAIVPQLHPFAPAMLGDNTIVPQPRILTPQHVPQPQIVTHQRVCIDVETDWRQTRKLIVCSHVKHNTPLRMLFQSMERGARFSQWDDVVVLLGGASAESIGVERLHGVTVAVIRTRQSAYDYHGFHQLYVHREHPLVVAGVYLYLHDTCIARAGFTQRFNLLCAAPHEILTVPGHNSSIVQ